MDGLIQTLCDRLDLLLEKHSPGSRRRIIIALAGTPGSGKSTVSDAVMNAFNRKRPSSVAVVPMDGFHHPKSMLPKLSTSECAFRRRGAPFTFDVDALLGLVKNLRETPMTSSTEPTKILHAPSFDHAVGDPVQEGICISSSQRIIIIEGNYLLLDQDPWNEIASLADETWFVSVDRDTAKKRLIKRHILTGVETNEDAAASRAEENDLVNSDLIMERMIGPDVIVRSQDI